MADKNAGDKLRDIFLHYGEAIGHIVGGGILFVVILVTVLGGSAAADWLMDGKSVDPWIVGAIFGIKFGALVLDGILLLAVGYKAIRAVLT